MKIEKIVWGLILLFIGGILLLENFGVFHFYWSSVWHLWPLILIVIGANMIVNRTNTRAGGIAGIVITLLVLGFVAYQGINGQYRSRPWFSYQYKNDNDTGSTDYSASDTWKTNVFTEPYAPNIKQAQLDITGGATTYTIKDSSANLIDIDVRHRNSGYTLTKTSSDSLEILKFSMRSGKNRFSFGGLDETEAKLKLSSKPVWNINVEMGAGESDFDLSGFKIDNLKLKGGAASFKVKLGMPQGITKVNTETGVAEVKISVPKDAACQIKVETGMSSKDFNGFTKQADGTYTSSNFNSTDKQIIIFLKGGLSDFEVSRY